MYAHTQADEQRDVWINKQRFARDTDSGVETLPRHYTDVYASALSETHAHTQTYMYLYTNYTRIYMHTYMYIDDYYVHTYYM